VLATIYRQDPQFESLQRGHNLCWPATEADASGRIEVCQDAKHLNRMRDLYTGLYSGFAVATDHKSTPYRGKYYEDRYINYPDVDMLEYAFWPELFYGQERLDPFLQDVKRQYDPNNIFHHAMSIRP